MDADDLSGAAQCLNEAVRLSPLYFKALYNRGKLRYKLEDYEGASSDFLKAVKLKPQNATLHDGSEIHFLNSVKQKQPVVSGALQKK